MVTRPEAKLGRHMITGLAAVALFAVMAAVFVQAEFAEVVAGRGFPDGSITAGIGYALFDLTDEVGGTIPSDGFLAAFLIIAVVLDAALDGALMLAKRDDGGEQ